MNTNSLEFLPNGKRIGWYCSCGRYSLVVKSICESCASSRPNEYSILGTKQRIERELRNEITVILGRFQMPLLGEELTRKYEKQYWSKEVDAKIELHMQFYNHEGKLCADMTDEELQEHLEELSNVAFEAKARIARISDDLRERSVKRKLVAGELLSKSDMNFDQNAAISVVTERKKRISKSERLINEMNRLLGVEYTQDTLAKLDKSKFNPDNLSVADRIAKSRQEKPLAEFCRIERHDECNGKFRIGEESHVCSCKCHAPKVDWDDPFGLNGNKSVEPTESIPTPKQISSAPIMDLSFDDFLK